MKYSILALVFVVLISAESSAQLFKQKDNIDNSYHEAVRDYKNGNYTAVLAKLSPLTNANSATKYAEYSHYYYALASYQLRKFSESRQMLMQLVNRFPRWNKMAEVNYLIGADYLAIGNWKMALQYFEKIKDSSFQEDVKAIKQQNLNTKPTLAELINLHQQFPEERLIAQEIVARVDKLSSPSKPDLIIAQNLQKKFNFNITAEKPKHNIPKIEGIWERDHFDVSVLMPFRLNEFSAGQRKGNQFAYDYYMGLELAKQTLRKEKININLVPYDISAEERQMKAIIKSKAFNESNLVIGPLYASTFDIASSYIEEANMLMLNPLSTDAALIKSTKNIYLAHPSIDYQVKKGVEWMQKMARNLSVAIYYGNSPKDSAMAFSYAAHIKEKSGKILDLESVGATREQMERMVKQFETDKPSHFVYFSSVSGSGQNFIQTLAGRNLSTVPVLLTGTSYNLRQAPSNYSNNIYLLEPDFIDKDKETVREFQKDFWNSYSTFPSVYAYQGYDQLLFFGRSMSKFKDKVRKGLELRSYTNFGAEYLLGGFDYTESNENQVPVILKYNGTKWNYVL